MKKLPSVFRSKSPVVGWLKRFTSSIILKYELSQISLHKNIRLININEKILHSQLSTLNSFIASSTILWHSFLEGHTNSQRAKSSLSTS